MYSGTVLYGNGTDHAEVQLSLTLCHTHRPQTWGSQESSVQTAWGVPRAASRGEERAARALSRVKWIVREYVPRFSFAMEGVDYMIEF